MPNRKLTRRELYDLVWSTPMAKLAAEFGISDVGLKKTCDRHRVPAPPRGYWAKLKAGQKPKRALFVEVKDAQLNQIEINPQTADLPESVRQIIDAQRAKRSLALKQPHSPKPGTFEPVIDVHPAVRKTAQVLRRCKPTDEAVHASGDGLCGISVGRESIERAVFVLDKLARLLAEKGTPLVPTGKAMEVTVQPESAVMVLKERTRMIDHHPTAEELAEEARRQEQLDRHWRNPARYPRPPYGRAYPDKDTVWTGELSLQIEGYCDGVRRKWADGQTQRLEDLVPSIANGVEVLLAARKAEREAREERDRRYAELERRRRLAKARQEREKSRIAFFDSLVALRRGADNLRKALQEVEPDSRSVKGIQISRMMAWGQSRLREMEERLQVEQIEQRLIEAKLFPAEDEDDLCDPLGEPPTGSSYW